MSRDNEQDLRILMPVLRLGLNDEEFAEFSAFCERLAEEEAERRLAQKKTRSLGGE